MSTIYIFDTKYDVMRFDVTQDPLFQEFILERNLSKSSIKSYQMAFQNYCNFHQMSLSELIGEADREEEAMVRAKNRKIIRRLKSYRTHLIQIGSSPRTVTGYYTRIKTIYKHNLIEIPYIPPVKLPTKQVMHHEIPQKKHIIEVLEHTNNLKHKAMIHFMASSGTARQEVCNLTIQDFIDATETYHQSKSIPIALEKLENETNVIPLFRMIRQKTGYKYYTLCTDEATQHILRYLKWRGYKNLQPNDSLFKINPNSVNKMFTRLNESCKYPPSFFHPHSLRKYQADILSDWDLTNMLQGRKPSSIKESYWKTNPERLKKEYMKHIEDLTLKPTKLITLESDEVKSLKAQLHREKTQRNKLEQQVIQIQSQLTEFEEMLKQFKQQE